MGAGIRRQSPIAPPSYKFKRQFNPLITSSLDDPITFIIFIQPAIVLSHLQPLAHVIQLLLHQKV